MKAGEISRVEMMLKTDLSGPAGANINSRMQEALERRKKALAAVEGVEALMTKAQPGVATASQILEDVEDVLRQINRDYATSSDALSKAITAAGKDVKERQEMEAALNKLKSDPKLSMVEEMEGVIRQAEEVYMNTFALYINFLSMYMNNHNHNNTHVPPPLTQKGTSILA
jgi:DNA repair exonuclease SbcCD ATPase subunit